MRFRLWLPVLQTMAMLLLIWAPWAPNAHKFDIVLTNGAEIKGWTLIPSFAAGFDAVNWSLGINLPAATIVIPAEFAIRKNGAMENDKVRFYGFWLAGILCWYMVGRFVDDLLQWRRTKLLPRKNPADLAFALLAVPSAILLGGAFTFGAIGSVVLAAWGAAWIVITSSALLFRIAQVIQQRRRTPVS
jgi:hypothetical protein